MDDYKTDTKEEKLQLESPPANNDPEMIDPLSSDMIDRTFASCNSYATEAFVFDGDNIVGLDMEKHDLICGVLDALISFFPSVSGIDIDDFFSSNLYIFTQILFSDLSIIDAEIQNLLVEFGYRILIHDFTEKSMVFIKPLIDITLCVKGSVLDRCICIMANCMAENHQLIKKKIHKQVTPYFIQLLQEKNITDIRTKNLLKFFSYLTFSFRSNFDLLCKDNEILILANFGLERILPFDPSLTEKALNLCAELCQFQSCIQYFKENNIYGFIIDCLNEHEKFSQMISEIDNEHIKLDENVVYFSFQIINGITKDEIAKGCSEYSIFQEDRFSNILINELVYSYPFVKQLIFFFITLTSPIYWSYYHEKGIISTLIGLYLDLSYNEKIFLLQCILPYLSNIPVEIAFEYLSGPLLNHLEFLFDCNCAESSEQLCEFIYNLANDSIMEQIREGSFAESLGNFIDSTTECPHAIRLMELINPAE